MPEDAEARVRAGSFSAEAFLARLRPEEAGEATEALRTLDALVKRVTISGRLHAFYRPDLSGPEGEEIAAVPCARLYCLRLLATASHHFDWKLLNAALHALDGRLAEPPLDDPDGALAAEASRVLALLDAHDA